jgi:pimeloyl-ACP methyl ester carboxylesterase
MPSSKRGIPTGLGFPGTTEGKFQMPHLRMEDGREIHYEASAPARRDDRTALVFHHGQPGAALLWPRFESEADRRGWDLIMLSRPGYATSERMPGRMVADVAADVAAVLDQLGYVQFVTVGWSGGGPHALACASLLETRCLAAATIAGVAPYEGVTDLDWTAGMGPENVEEFQALIAGDPGLEERVGELMVSFRDIQASQLIDALGGLLSAPDKRALEGEDAEFMAAWMRLAASTGSAGYWDDDIAFIRYWGFDLAKIAVPVTVWRAGQDLMVPPSHGEWLAANIPGASARAETDEGHISLLTKRFGGILDQLADDAGLS